VATVEFASSMRAAIGVGDVPGHPPAPAPRVEHIAGVLSPAAQAAQRAAHRDSCADSPSHLPPATGPGPGRETSAGRRRGLGGAATWGDL